MKPVPWSIAGVGLLVAILGAGDPGDQIQVPSTIDDFFQPGSQPNEKGSVVYEEIVTSSNCRICHEAADDDLFIYSQWQGSMMAQAARDPMFYACLAIANQDAAQAGDICIRCHTPKGWIEGRSSPTDGSKLTDQDLDGVTCSVCHRLVDPVYKAGVSPPLDDGILANIDPLPSSPGGGNFILDPQDFRRGPFDDIVTPGHVWLHSPFHQTSELCATCHDVSNPMYLRQDGGAYTLTDLGAAHPTADKYDMFPLERTYSEWLNSTFATVGVDMGGRFGGNKTIMRTCQDCHMPDIDGPGCTFPDAPLRDDMPAHELIGANAWALSMVANLYPNDVYLPYIEAGRLRAISMLERAATLEVTQLGQQVKVRVINETGHKLPTGYPEGRRMWLNVQVFDGENELIAERGHYDTVEAELTTTDTTVYEQIAGIDEAIAEATGVPEGESFHFALNNMILKDNRIPPRGFDNAAFEAVQAMPVAKTYKDGQYWDDSIFALPPDAARVTVRLHYQSASKEYITFLRDENHTNDAGDILYEQWELTDKSPPVLMASVDLELDIVRPCAMASDCADADGDGVRDALCVRWTCEAGVCIPEDVGYGDIGGNFGECQPDGATDGHDHFHALACFGNVGIDGPAPYPCEDDAPHALTADIGGPFAACLPDGICDGHDAFMVTNVLGGAANCLCPGDGGHPAPVAPLNTVAAARLALVAERSTIAAGDTVAVEVIMQDTLEDLRGYQLHTTVDGGRSGTLELVDIVVQPALTRADHRRATPNPLMAAFNLGTHQIFAGLPAGGVTVMAGARLATFTFRASGDASGPFVVDLRYDEDPADRTFLFAATPTDRIVIKDVAPAVITVKGTTRPRKATRR